MCDQGNDGIPTGEDGKVDAASPVMSIGFLDMESGVFLDMESMVFLEIASRPS
ncbi:hypothetical protein [Corynebacterium sp. HMSC29G08]|uniref:hypothetical protein n=1 Tax=Corynebacterium sp. HMSC29G08 TaxID=1581069 RepID=UPI001438E4AD|nr:hypothetical protein [Corynebacterium sp. HMSC29G08]